MLADTGHHFEDKPYNDCRRYSNILMISEGNIIYEVLEFININDTEVLLVQLATDMKALIWTDVNNDLSILPLSV